MIAVNILSIRITAMVPVLGAMLLIGAVECAYCQVDLVDRPGRLSATQGVVSKNQLLIPEKAQKAMDRAQVDFLHRRYESAQRDVQRALQIYPHCALAFTFQGILDLRDGNVLEAAEAFQRAINEDPASGSAYIGLGIILNTQSRFRDAIALFDRAAPFSQGSWLRDFESALAHLGVQEYDAALKDITRAERLAGSDPESSLSTGRGSMSDERLRRGEQIFAGGNPARPKWDVLQLGKKAPRAARSCRT